MNKLDDKIRKLVKDDMFEAIKSYKEIGWLCEPKNISQIKQSILKAIMEELNKLMDDKQIAKLEKRFKLFSRGWHKKCCPMCGVQPSYQKKLILSVIKDLLE